MVITDLMGKVNILSRWMICCSLLVLNLGNQLNAQTLVCDGQINVSLGEDCDEGSQITPAMILQGMIGGDCDYEILLSGQGYNSTSNAGAGICYAEIFNPGNYSVTVTNGNNSCWGKILAEDKLGPQIDCTCSDPAAPCTLPAICTGIDTEAVIPPTATDCDGVSHHSFRDVVTGGGCGESTYLTRIWTFVDNIGNVSTCSQYYVATPYEFTFDGSGNNTDLPDDNQGIECPVTEVDLPCGAGTEPGDVYDFYYAKWREDFPPSDPISEEYLLSNHYYAVRHAYPFLVNYDGLGELLGVTGLNGTACNLFASYEDIDLAICNTDPECSGNNKVIREWKIFDWCNSTAEPYICTQVIKAVDTEAPTIGVADFTSSVDPWGCTATVYFPKPSFINDNCSPTAALNYVVSTGSGTTDMYGVATGSGTGLQGVVMGYDPNLGYYATNVPAGHHLFYYNAWDCCTNIGSEEVWVSVKDATPPVAITKQDIVVSLIPNPGSPGEPGVTKVFAESIDNGSFDGCGNVKLEIRRESQACNFPSSITYNNDFHSNDDTLDFDDGKFVQFCCNDLEEFGIDADGDGANDYAQIKVWLRVWDDGDGDGYMGSAGDNYSEVWSWVRLEDKSRATILCPGDIVVDCEGDPYNMSAMGTATGYNSCGTQPVDYIDISTNLSNCSSGTITRQWFVVGNESINCVQNITKEGVTSTDLDVTFPRDTVINCAESVTDRPTWNAGPCEQIAVNVDRDTFYFQDGACYKILNYWTVINWCDYVPNDPLSDGIWSHVQVVKIVDNTAPVIAGCGGTDLAVGDDCQGPVMLTASASDDGICASNRLRWTAQVDLYSDNNVEYNFSSNNNPSDDFYIPTSSSGEEVKITLPEGVPGSTTQHRVIWKVSDGCGNITSCESYFTVEDAIPPTPYCVNLSSALTAEGTVELWACDFDLGAFDNCTAQDDLRYTFTDIAPSDDPDYNELALCSAMTFDCDDIVNPAGSIVTLNVYVWDANGNADFCTVFLTLVDNNGVCGPVGSRNISGDISTEEGEMVEDVRVELISNQPLYPAVQMTDQVGNFMFTSNLKNKDYQISNTKNDNYLNGVSTIDLVMIQRHILGLETLTSPYKLIAADINNDQVINGSDLIELRKLILGIYTELPQNDSWRFINSSQSMDQQYPWPLSEIRMILDLDNDMMQEDFVGVKIGDINGSAIANAVSSTVSARSGQELSLNYDDKSYNEGEIVNMKLSVDDITELSGLQFTLNTSGLEVVDVISDGMEISEGNFAVLSDNATTFSWNSSKAVAKSEFFTIQFKATEAGTLSDNVTITSDITPAEAYAGNDLRIIPITLTGQNNSEQEFALYQNSPNPFNGTSEVAFNLPTSSMVTFTVSDVNGKIIWKHFGKYESGLNNVTIDSEVLNVSGVLYYKLDTDQYSATKKMIVLK